MADLTAQCGSAVLRTPIVLASGPSGFGAELLRGAALAGVGAVTTKTLTPTARGGNPQPRLVDAPAGVLNSVGLENPGLESFLQNELPGLRELPAAIVVSMTANDPAEIGRMAMRLSGELCVAAIELNLSCPNVSGRPAGDDPVLVGRFVRAAVDCGSKPVLAKLAGDRGDVRVPGEAALTAGAAGLTLINSVRGVRIDRRTGRPLFHRVFGGLSGPAILPIALARVYEARLAFPDALIVGTGGVTDLGGLLEMLFAGADLVGIGFGVMGTPRLAGELAAELDRWLADHGIVRAAELVSAAHRGGIGVPVGIAALNR